MHSVVLLMAGNASRMNLNENKVFLPLAEKMVFEHSLGLFLSLGLEVICVIRPGDEDKLRNYPSVKITYGGKTRQESVYNGLKLVSNEYVLIHDAARPFINKKTVIECIDSLEAGYAVLVASQVKDSIYINNPTKSLKRDELVAAQTPQAMRTSVLVDCHKKANGEDYLATDDISLILKYSNEVVKIVEGGDENFKITTQLDYILAKEVIKHHD